MPSQYYTELAQQLIAEQGDEASEHLAEAIGALRAVGDQKGAKLLMRIARRIELLDDPLPLDRHARRHVIRRPRNAAFDPSG